MNFDKVLFTLDNFHLESNLILKSIFKKLMKGNKLISIKKNVFKLKKLIFRNINDLPQIFINTDDQNFLKEFCKHAILIPFELIINFIYLIKDSPFVNGAELIMTKDLIWFYIHYFLLLF